jgi:hypothetical protein
MNYLDAREARWLFTQASADLLQSNVGTLRGVRLYWRHDGG